MKLTDLSLIFVVILIPIVIMVYINTSFVVKAEKEEMYYKNIINSSIKDATSQMKYIENKDAQIDYGYSGSKDSKVSINTKVAIDTFYNSLSNNFGIAGNKDSKDALKAFIPAIAILDYDGIYIHSAEEVAGNIVYVTKPKQYYTYCFALSNSSPYNIIESGFDVALEGIIFEVTYTMDEDFIYLDVYDNNGAVDPATGIDTRFRESASFFTDNSNNLNFIYDIFTSIPGNLILAYSIDNTGFYDIGGLRDKIKEQIIAKRKEVITKISIDAISQAVNSHNTYAEMLGVKYDFVFSETNETEWYESINGIGMVAIIQGISLGNRYLDYRAYSVTSLSLSKKYYLSNAILTGSEVSIDTYLRHKLYHISEECPLYKEYIFRNLNDYDRLTPKFYYNAAEAAANGYSPCPVCKP